MNVPAVDALLPVCRAEDLEKSSDTTRWLLRDMWLRSAVGIIGGEPKASKSWLALDIAVSVASATPCLGHFAVEDPGRALVYLAEDALPEIRKRLEGICRQRGLPLGVLDLYVITAPSLRLDDPDHLVRLTRTIEHLAPRLLVLDPLVRLHRLDENSSADISRLLGTLRDIQRRFDLSVVLVHHTSKRKRTSPGQALRGSSDLHAWVDSACYLTRKADTFELVLEHRAAPGSKRPHVLRLDASTNGTALLLAAPPGKDTSESLEIQKRLLSILRTRPLGRTLLREALGIRNERLGQILEMLERDGRIERNGKLWHLVGDVPNETALSQKPQATLFD